MRKSNSLPVSPLGVVLAVAVVVTAVARMAAEQTWWQAPVWLLIAALSVWRPGRGLIAALVWLGAASIATWWAYVVAAVVALGLMFLHGPGDAARNFRDPNSVPTEN